ncbi:FAD-dependent oxidoreductase [Nocardioides dilutus]
MSGRSRPLRIAVVGAGPAGIYAAHSLIESGTDVSIDVIERLPAPFGLIRYGVAPDHPRIKGIVTALHKVLDRPQVRLLGNVEYGTDLDLTALRRFYDAALFATGADADRDLALPGIDLEGSHGAAEFVSWYDGHPDAPRTWPLHAEKVAVLGVGNVALDVARILAKTGDELLATEIPPNVYRGLQQNQVREVHVFGRRGPAQAKFSPLELRELNESPTFDVVVDPKDMSFDRASRYARRDSKQLDMIASTLELWSTRTAASRARQVFLHFFESPVAVLGTDGRVTGLRTERTAPDGTGNVVPTGQKTDWPVGAVYRAVGYRSRRLPDLPFDALRGTVPNVAGRVQASDGTAVPATYVTGWIKRGPVGLIGHTKSDANETVTSLLADSRDFAGAEQPSESAVLDHLCNSHVQYTTWEGWYRLDAHERRLGEPEDRERVKVVDRDQMLAISRRSAEGERVET